MFSEGFNSMPDEKDGEIGGWGWMCGGKRKRWESGSSWLDRSKIPDPRIPESQGLPPLGFQAQISGRIWGPM
jgi:hypothetical protein